MKAKKRQEKMTNDEFMLDLMTYGGPHGPLTQAFVIEALAQYAKQVIYAGAEACDSALLSGKAWVRTAEYVAKRIKENYE